jgi:hypothetical protein
MISEPALATGTRFCFEAVDEVDDVIEPAAHAGSDAASGNGDGEMGLAGAGSADQDGVALLGDESAASEILDERFVDRSVTELEAIEVLGERELGDGELVLDGARLFLAGLGFEQIADDALGLVLAFDRGCHDLVEGGLHAVELELVHEFEELGSFHQMVLLRLS